MTGWIKGVGWDLACYRALVGKICHELLEQLRDLYSLATSLSLIRVPVAWNTPVGKEDRILTRSWWGRGWCRYDYMTSCILVNINVYMCNLLGVAPITICDSVFRVELIESEKANLTRGLQSASPARRRPQHRRLGNLTLSFYFRCVWQYL